MRVCVCAGDGVDDGRWPRLGMRLNLRSCSRLAQYNLKGFTAGRWSTKLLFSMGAIASKHGDFKFVSLKQVPKSSQPSG